MNFGNKASDMTSIGAFASPITSVGGWNQLGGYRAGNIGGGHIIQDGNAFVAPSTMDQSAEMAIPIPVGLLNLQSMQAQAQIAPLNVYLI